METNLGDTPIFHWTMICGRKFSTISGENKWYHIPHQAPIFMEGKIFAGKNIPKLYHHIGGFFARWQLSLGGLGWNFGWGNSAMRTIKLTQIHPCLTSYTVYWQTFIQISTWVFPKIVGFPPKSSILIGFSIIFTIHFGVPPLFLETPTSILNPKPCQNN